MKTLNKIGIGAALAASTLAFSTVGMSSAQAAVFGRFEITGTASIIPDEEIRFNTARVEQADPLAPINSFTVLGGTSVTLGGIDLSNPVVLDAFNTSYTGNVPNPFITFAADPDLIFTADNPFPVTLINVGTGVTGALAPITGTFTNLAGISTGRGIATINFIETTGSYSLSIEAQPIAVPEPTTTLGLAALGLGAFFSSKKKKAQVSA